MPSRPKPPVRKAPGRGASERAAVDVDTRPILQEVLKAAEPRPAPTATPSEKGKYASRFADKMAELLARDLTPRLPGITATTKREAGSVRANKQLDVNFSTPQLGLALGISLKSVHIREPKPPQRYTHNMKRNEEELRIEASGYHKRQPYAVMIGVLFLPFDSCQDGKQNASSFGSWVRHLRPYAGRASANDDVDRFERLYVALYELDGSDLQFFDIRSAPPKNGRPPSGGNMVGPGGPEAAPLRPLSYDELLEEIYHLYLRRNAADFEWLGGEEEPLATDEIEPGTAAE